MKSTTKFGMLLLAALFPCVSASAQTYPAVFNGISPAISVRGTVDDVNFHDAQSGVFDFGWFQAFCVESLEPLDIGVPFDYVVADFSSVPNADAISRLVAAFLSSPQDADHAAAIQWAIWEVLDESLQPWSLTDGNVRIDTTVSEPTATLANQYLADLNNFAPATLVYLTNPTQQNVISWNIPEPSAFGLAALAGGVLLLRRRR